LETFGRSQLRPEHGWGSTQHSPDPIWWEGVAEHVNFDSLLHKNLYSPVYIPE